MVYSDSRLLAVLITARNRRSKVCEPVLRAVWHGRYEVRGANASGAKEKEIISLYGKISCNSRITC